jgi:guanosine-3',5'-bis(diphosphate) 3'-pyrophosphohydrolase
MDILSQIQEFARQAHGDQQRKFEEEPYIRHLVRVKDLCAEYTTSTRVLAAALLHDTLEDTDTTPESLLAFLNTLVHEDQSRSILGIVVELTDVYVKKNFPQWNRRKRKQKEAARLAAVSADAQTVKYSDIIDNSLTIAGADDSFVRTYLMECRAILKVMNQGNGELYQQAVKVVNDCISRIN